MDAACGGAAEDDVDDGDADAGAEETGAEPAGVDGAPDVDGAGGELLAEGLAEPEPAPVPVVEDEHALSAQTTTITDSTGPSRIDAVSRRHATHARRNAGV